MSKDEKKVVALVTIHKTVTAGVAGDKNAGIAPKKPKILEIEPGTIMMVGTDEYKELKALKAIRDYTETDLKAYEKIGLVVDTGSVVQSDGTETSEKEEKAAAKKAAAETAKATKAAKDAKGKAEDAKSEVDGASLV